MKHIDFSYHQGLALQVSKQLTVKVDGKVTQVHQFLGLLPSCHKLRLLKFTKAFTMTALHVSLATLNAIRQATHKVVLYIVKYMYVHLPSFHLWTELRCYQ